jgi:Skp family chaperone for outer membrane proteins
MAKKPIFAALPLILLFTMATAAQAAQTDSRAYGYFGVTTAQARHHAQRSARPIMPHVPAHSRDDVQDPLADIHLE